MKTVCPTPTDLLRAVLEHGPDVDDALTRHVSLCESCSGTLERMRAMVGVVQSSAPSASPAAGPCLDESDIAALLDGLDPEMDDSAIAHLVACERCRTELAAATRLIRDSSVVQEIAAVERLDRRTTHRTRTSRAAMTVGLAAAAVAGIVLLPRSWHESAASGRDTAILRERAITTTAAPSILGPVGPTTPTDSLHWTSVPRADLYRVTVWDREGTVVWQEETRDTILELPDEIGRTRGQPLLWAVKARTGWDRWVESDLAEFIVHHEGRTNP